MSMSELQRSIQGSAPGGSPIKKSIGGSHAYSAGPTPSALENRKTMADEMKGLWVGPMPVQEFLDDFLPLDKVKGVKAAPQLPTYFDGIKKTKIEKEMYGDFINLVHDEKLNLIPGFKIVDTSNHPDHESRDGKKIKPDPTLYKKTVDTSKNVTQFGELELNFEFKTDKYHEPFDDLQGPIGTFETTTNNGKDCRGQLANYATEWCTRQHRLFAFSIFISDPYVRFIRWDRSGAIVSARFDFRTNSQPLIDFLWRFSRLESDTLRGKDETVRLANEEEIALAHEHLEKWKNPYDRPVIVLQIENREFIAWGSMSDAESLTGRSTRAYPVYEKVGQQVMFLKDTWRAVTLERESDILKTLNGKGVRNVPKFVCGGDIVHHTTLSDSYGAEDPLSSAAQVSTEVPSAGDMEHSALPGESDAPAFPESDYKNASTISPTTARSSWRIGKQKIVQRIHHRFTEDLVGTPLTGFESSHQMMTAVHDAYIAHYDAYHLCQILHRDISIKNILLNGGGRGVLNDWDLAKSVTSTLPRQHVRTGTWQFISTLNLEFPGKVHTIQDDIESFVLLVLYIVLRYTQHSQMAMLTSTMTQIFDSCVILEDGTAFGGVAKRVTFSDRTYIGVGFNVTHNEPLTIWLEIAFDAVAAYHGYYIELTKIQGSKYRRSVAPNIRLEDLALKDHNALDEAWKDVLAMSNWPSGDTASDNFKPKSSKPIFSGSKGKRALDQADAGPIETPKPKRVKSSGNILFDGKEGTSTREL